MDCNFMGLRNLLYLFLVVGINLLGQTKELSIPKYKNGELTFACKLENQRADKLDLTDIKRSEDSIYFRLSTENQILDIHSKDGNTYGGELIIYTSSYDQEQKKK
jgi:hypothetical protein